MNIRNVKNALILGCKCIDTAIGWGLDTNIRETYLGEKREFFVMLDMSMCDLMTPAARLPLLFPNDFREGGS